MNDMRKLMESVSGLSESAASHQFQDGLFFETEDIAHILNQSGYEIRAGELHDTQFQGMPDSRTFKYGITYENEQGEVEDSSVYLTWDGHQFTGEY